MGRRALLYAVPLLAAIAACGLEPPPRPPQKPAGAIMVVNRAPGLATALDRWMLPEIALYGDGTAVLRDGPLTARVRHVPADRVLSFTDDLCTSGVDTGEYLPGRYAVLDPTGPELCRLLTGTTHPAGTVIRPLPPDEQTCADLGQV